MLEHPRPGLSPGTAAPDIELRSTGGRYTSLTRERRGRRLLLIFIQPDCPYSQELGPVIAGLRPDPPADVPMPVVITAGPEVENRRFIEMYGLRCPVFIQDDMEACRLYGIGETPAGCLIDRSGHTEGWARTGAVGVLALAGVAPGPDWTTTTTVCRSSGDRLDELLARQAARGEFHTIDPASIQSESLTTEGLDAPPVSVILCTRDRPRFLSMALECYRYQTYVPRELIVVDNGTAVPAGEDAVATVGGRVVRVPPDMPLGAMLNEGIRQARGRLCQKWDDDDWYAPDFLATLVSGFLQATKEVDRSAIVYLTRVLELDLRRWRVDGPSWSGPVGSTLLFERDAWAHHPFRETRTSEDWWFVVDGLRSGSLAVPIHGSRLYLCVKHTGITGERPHSYIEHVGASTIPDAPSEGLDPSAVLPDWALSAYEQLRQENGARTGSGLRRLIAGLTARSGELPK